MKKIYVLFVISALTVSCSDDSQSHPGGSLAVTIDGVAKTFNKVTVTNEFNQVSVTAQIGESSEEVLSFFVTQGDTGSDILQSFSYMKDGIYYFNGGFGATFTSNVTSNSGRKVTGNFSGNLQGYNPTTDETIIVETLNGLFSVTY